MNAVSACTKYSAFLLIYLWKPLLVKYFGILRFLLDCATVTVTLSFVSAVCPPWQCVRSRDFDREGTECQPAGWGPLDRPACGLRLRSRRYGAAATAGEEYNSSLFNSNVFCAFHNTVSKQIYRECLFQCYNTNSPHTDTIKSNLLAHIY